MLLKEWVDLQIPLLAPVYGIREARNIIKVWLEDKHGIRNLQQPTTQAVSTGWQLDMAKLLQFEPVQYITQKAFFFDHWLYVDKSVLIPRPETEELVQLAIQHFNSSSSPHILDIGTGSGCIAISLALALPRAKVSAIDISFGALEVAQLNADNLGASIHLMEMDFLDERLWQQLPSFDLIISNPPYIALQEAAQMEKNVIDHEPHLALFPKYIDPLIFYRKLAQFGKNHLSPGGAIMAEINSAFGNETAAIFKAEAYQATSIIKDMHGKDRIVKVI
ncbi:MAG: peptide chain release factor N(5)-glutamine methyltransferase [Chitinophagales bacterium]|nr:peptide chain release factor N(5)-glutamine methyltransferase [Chitinophagales bacterium]